MLILLVDFWLYDDGWIGGEEKPYASTLKSIEDHYEETDLDKETVLLIEKL